ncbi:hypothetical protein [Methylobacterium brachythecii]|uniref:Uncharacterized protein n=1 Tax=Methylobacterium brachythecii TaxID=1176177 RepID=A0A7W6F6X0_9HYPH|nr:hypothetical protein [Methylobacterium brachythecii]MBB3902763.1 hypothetical protein [Methylobacterium brachythecii]GLS42607.1 hypothetical protein GCM10007884_05920 [Methylobacterium brachythecii]
MRQTCSKADQPLSATSSRPLRAHPGRFELSIVGSKADIDAGQTMTELGGFQPVCSQAAIEESGRSRFEAEDVKQMTPDLTAQDEVSRYPLKVRLVCSVEELWRPPVAG